MGSLNIDLHCLTCGGANEWFLHMFLQKKLKIIRLLQKIRAQAQGQNRNQARPQDHLTLPNYYRHQE